MGGRFGFLLLFQIELTKAINFTKFSLSAMKYSGLLFLLILGIFSGCEKDPPISKTPTPGWPHGCWNVKYVISGASVPDSVHLNVNMTDYVHNVILPSLPLSDSTVFCGDYGSGVNVFLFDHDTSKIYNCKIYINNVLKANITGKSSLPPYWLSAGAQCL